MTAFLLLALAALAPPLREEAFDLARPSEVVALISASCERCAWGREGREAAALALWVDGRFSQHLLLVGGETPTEYGVALGGLPPGRHRLALAVDPAVGAGGARGVSVGALELRPTPEGAGEHLALAFAPLLHPSRNGLERFEAVPLLLWYERQPTPRGTRLRYSAILSGTSRGVRPDELMATRGRVADLVELYAVEFDSAGRVLAEELLAPGGAATPFKGEREGRHPLLWLNRDGRVSEHGEKTTRYAPAPFAFGFMGTAREAVMDAHPWTYRVMIQEAGRKGLLIGDARQGSGKIPDPRRFVYVEACAELENAALSLAVAIERGGRLRWRESDVGGPAFRLAESGCFRGAVALSPRDPVEALAALRFRAFAAGREPGGSSARLTRVNRVFVLSTEGMPGPNLFRWSGDVALRPGEAPYTLLFDGESASNQAPVSRHHRSDPAGARAIPPAPGRASREAATREGGAPGAPPSRPAPGSRSRANR